jgi:phosphatidylserine/phosphatidylglycerophosphate/cardiolipin synthase-like enzyme
MPPPTILATVLPHILGWLTSKKVRKTRRGAGRGLLPSAPRVLLLLGAIGAAAWWLGGERIAAWVRRHLPSAGTAAAGGTVDGAVRVYFTRPGGDPADPGNIAHAVVKYVDAARTSVDVAAYELDNTIITDALVRAHRRGVRVRLVTDLDYAGDHGPQALRAAGVPVVEDNRQALMHNKFMVFDGTAVWTGSMNFTENCAYKNDNHGLYLAVPELAENYATKFRWMFEDRAFGRPPHPGAKIPNPVVAFADGTVIETYFAPHDRVGEKVIAAVNEANAAIDFLAFSFTHPGIGAAVAGRARQGVAVRGVFEKSQAAGPYSQYTPLKGLGLPVYFDANPRNMHHKAMILDGKTTIGGSFNFSANADTSNDENLVVIRNNPAVAGAFTAEFGRVLAAARAAGR